MKKVLINKNKKKIKLVLKTNINNNFCDKTLSVTGPLGTIDYTFKNQNIYDNTNLFIIKKNWNFFIKKINTLIKSVTNGWFVELNLNGLGFKSFKLNDKIALDLGYSNLIIYKPTNKIKIKNLKNRLVLFSINREYLHDVSFNLKNYSKPDSYKGKGILFKNEIIKLKKKAKS